MKYNERLKEVLEFAEGEWDNMDLLFAAVKEDLSLQMLGTTPDEESKRNQIYYTARAIDAFAAKLQDCINECKSIKGDN